jgi:glucoamylase
VGKKMKLLVLAILASLSFASNEPVRLMPLEKWLPQQEQIAVRNLLRNISPAGTAKGVVVASPSRQDPDYWFHWVRDAALVMNVIVEDYSKATTPEKKAYFLEMLWDYVEFSRLNQMTPTPSGGPGEPKFNVDGSAFVGPWGRPQNDGPALRALTLMRFARALISESKSDEIRRIGSIIKYDLEFVSHHWREASFDLWEEIKGHHFYTLINQYQALVDGSSYLSLLGDKGAAEWYEKQAHEIKVQLNKFWDSQHSFIVSTRNRVGGIDYKKSNLDSSVLLGVLHANTTDIFSVDDPKVEATVLKLKQTFKTLYSINQSGPAGVAVGRYPEDKYDGYSSHGDGNPWILITNGFAEYYYRLGKMYLNRKRIIITPSNKDFFRDLGFDLSLGVIDQSSRTFSTLIERLQTEGDAYLTRVKYHLDSDGQMSEQMNRWSGFLQGARDLTWSYASFLTALQSRF